MEMAGPHAPGLKNRGLKNGIRRAVARSNDLKKTNAAKKFAG
ncbi:hypothetical protein PLANPX_1602 [Lacipirellula parvula]|uniref:Uncharacterized protein n=1 Tax=Lacipirellula parvula TaxID=2650471 RepID=A0A5K7X5Z9_9BACT|nr:hypothetical protein PLANPX_1602 [Lacipirellula parvula]